MTKEDGLNTKKDGFKAKEDGFKRETRSAKKKSRFVRNLILVVILILFGFFVFNKEHLDWIESFYPVENPFATLENENVNQSNEPAIESDIKLKEATEPKREDVTVLDADIKSEGELLEGAPIPENKFIADALENNYSVGAEPPILNFAPEATPIEEIEVANPYAVIIEKEVYSSDATNPIILKRKADEYRVYLANAYKLIDKFDEDKNYDVELEIMKKINVPAHVEEIIQLLETYNQRLMLSYQLEDDVVEPFGFKFLSELVTVRKTTTKQQEKLNLKNTIRKDLNILTDYIYSPELLDSFLNK